jgi:hypothetical protein
MRPSANIRKWRRLRRHACLTVLALVCASAGCQSYHDQSAALAGAWQAGDMARSVRTADRAADARGDGRDGLLWRLEQGATLRAAAIQAGSDEALLRRSTAAFDQAEERIAAAERQAALRIGAETGALLSNQAALPYNGRAYDKVMLNTYKALNYLQLGDLAAARVELNRALQRQRDAVAANARRIEEAAAATRQARAGSLTDEEGRALRYDVDRARADPQSAPALRAIEADLAPHLHAYADYVNPFTVFLDGLFFMLAGQDGADAERARLSLERAAAMAPANPYLRADLAAAEAVARGATPDPVTYVIFETGSAPWREEIRIDIPTFIITDNLAYIGAAFPRLRFVGEHLPELTVQAAGQSHRTALVASMDSVIAQDFNNEWPTIVTRTLLSTAAKAALLYAVQKEARHDNPLAQLLTIAGIVYQSIVNQADLRTWLTLPKEFQYCRFATPASGSIILRAQGRDLPVALAPGRSHVVYVRSVRAGAPLFVSHFVIP